MKIVIGFGNELRGEDAFGIDVIKELQKKNIKNTKVIKLFQLTPELCLDLLDCDEIIFVDSTFSKDSQYALACIIKTQKEVNISHDISISIIKEMLKSLYNHSPKILIYSMLTNNFDQITDKNLYEKCIFETCKSIISFLFDKK